MFQAAVIAPTFNNAGTLPRVLRALDELGLSIIVVDDGCVDETVGILRAWQAAASHHIVITHPENRGKAAALRSAFQRAAAMGHTHAVTIDTDGQLNPAQIPDLLELARRSPESIVLGCRDANAPDYPTASLLGRRAANLLVRWECGLRVADSQCGLRVYPLRLIERLPCRTERFNFETEILTRAAWAGIPIQECPVQCVYDLPDGRISHFRPWRDSLSSVGMHVRLLTTRFLWWISPVRARRALRDDPLERSRYAAGLAIGVFIANLPLYGLQTLLSLYTARRMRMNPLPVLVGSHLSTPPIGPVLIAMAIALGHWFLHGTLPTFSALHVTPAGYGVLIRSVLLEWLLGSLACGAILASLTYLLMRLLLRYLPARMPAAPAIHRAAPAPVRDRAIAEQTA